MKDKVLVWLTTDRPISKTGFAHHVLRATPWLNRNGKLGVVKIVKNEVVMLPPGGQVLPYFKDSSGRWKIVLVRQYRSAIKKVTFEGAGGRVENGETAQTALSRELEEETGIKISPELIQIVFEEYVHPSILSATVFGGIVEITENIVEDKKNAGKKCENEQTQVEISDLILFIKKRRVKLVKVDLLTSRLVDEVAKATGLLVKKY